MSPITKYIYRRAIIMSFIGAFVLLLFCWSSVYPDSHRHPDANVEESRKASLPIPLNVKHKICHVNFTDGRTNIKETPDLNIIYYVTPTYPRAEQIPELTRLAHTLMHVPGVHWIVADDQQICSEPVLKILRKTGLPFTQIASPKPFLYKTAKFPRGVSNRRAAIEWLQSIVKKGILYMGDDDNTVDLELFNEIRRTKKVSMFPVGLIGRYGVSSPVVKNGKVVKFFDSWPAGRTFPVDMAGFAINIEFLKPTADMPYIEGHEENKFLLSLGLKIEDIEPLANNCSKVLVWHTRTEKYEVPDLRINVEKRSPDLDNFAALLTEISTMGIAHLKPDNSVGLEAILNRLP